MSWCKHCGMRDSAKAEIRHQLKMARSRAEKPIGSYGAACAAMVPYYERALAELEAASLEWDRRLHEAFPDYFPAPPAASGGREP